MSEAGAFVAEAWRDGVGPDDRTRVEALRADDAELALFAALCGQLAHEPVKIPPPPRGGAATVVHAAAMLGEAGRAGEPRAIDAAVAALEDALAALEDEDPRARAARAWADHALGELAIAVGESRVARQRFEAVALADRPVALRALAMLQLVALAVERRDIETARAWARRAVALVDADRRPRQAQRARLVCGLLDYAVGDRERMREALDRGDQGPVARLLLATAEPSLQAMQILAELVRTAVAERDPLTYALCVLVGGRRYAALGRPADALVMIDTAISELAELAPHLAAALAEERAGYSAEHAGNEDIGSR